VTILWPILCHLSAEGCRSDFTLADLPRGWSIFQPNGQRFCLRENVTTLPAEIPERSRGRELAGALPQRRRNGNARPRRPAFLDLLEEPIVEAARQQPFDAGIAAQIAAIGAIDNRTVAPAGSRRAAALQGLLQQARRHTAERLALKLVGQDAGHGS
jgi:hypothetical protein